jgi:hypothetical protein
MVIIGTLMKKGKVPVFVDLGINGLLFIILVMAPPGTVRLKQADDNASVSPTLPVLKEPLDLRQAVVGFMAIILAV